jgi:hypothetical protein
VPTQVPRSGVRRELIATKDYFLCFSYQVPRVKEAAIETGPRAALEAYRGRDENSHLLAMPVAAEVEVGRAASSPPPAQSTKPAVSYAS